MAKRGSIGEGPTGFAGLGLVVLVRARESRGCAGEAKLNIGSRSIIVGKRLYIMSKAVVGEYGNLISKYRLELR